MQVFLSALLTAGPMLELCQHVLLLGAKTELGATGSIAEGLCLFSSLLSCHVGLFILPLLCSCSINGNCACHCSPFLPDQPAGLA